MCEVLIPVNGLLCAHLLLHKWQRNRETGALSWLAFHADHPAMFFHNRFHDRQPKAIAFNVFDILISHPMEATEDERQFVRRDTVSGILDLDDCVPIQSPEREDDGTASGRILDSIVQ
jgi:hypothetical protein